MTHGDLAHSEYDVAVVGAGPAGAAAAKALSGHGLNTVILEKARLPRYKMCSGVLSPSSVKHVEDNFGDIPEYILSQPRDVYGALIYTGQGDRVVEVAFKDTEKGPGLKDGGLSIRRPEFDYWLASNSGAELVDQCHFKHLTSDDARTTLILDHDGQKKQITARYVIGADGPLSRVRHSLSPEFSQSLRFIPNYEEWYTGSVDLEPGWLNVFMDGRYTSYFASVFMKDSHVVVVTGAKQGDPIKQYFAALIEYLKRDFGLRIEEKKASYGCVLHDMSATNNFHTGAGNVLLAGEAAGFSRALGEGISSALLTGHAAGQSVLQSLDTGRPAHEYYAAATKPEAEICDLLNRMLEKDLGLNPFTR